jgi:glycogen debranching enzyme
MEELYSTEGDYGLRTLSEPNEAYVEYVTPYHYHFGTLN